MSCKHAKPMKKKYALYTFPFTKILHSMKGNKKIKICKFKCQTSTKARGCPSLLKKLNNILTKEQFFFAVSEHVLN